MSEIRQIDLVAYEDLMKTQPTTWSRAFFNTGIACDAVENGISECFNSLIVEARTKPIISMLEDIRIHLMQRMNNMKEKASKWTDEICPSIRKKLEKLKDLQRYWFVIVAGEDKFEVKNGIEGFIVNTLDKTCTCRSWQLVGFPCVHGMATIMYLHAEPDMYVCDWYRKTIFDVTYSHSIGALNGSNMWPKTVYTKPLPPIVRTMPGRPKKKRKRDRCEAHTLTKVSSVGRVLRCRVCNQAGHNITTCTANGGRGSSRSGDAGRGRSVGAGRGGRSVGRGAAGRGNGSRGVRESLTEIGGNANQEIHQPDLKGQNEEGTQLMPTLQDTGTQESRIDERKTKKQSSQPSKLRNKSQRIILMKLKKPADPTAAGSTSDKPVIL